MNQLVLIGRHDVTVPLVANLLGAKPVGNWTIVASSSNLLILLCSKDRSIYSVVDPVIHIWLVWRGLIVFSHSKRSPSLLFLSLLCCRKVVVLSLIKLINLTHLLESLVLLVNIMPHLAELRLKVIVVKAIRRVWIRFLFLFTRVLFLFVVSPPHFIFI